MSDTTTTDPELAEANRERIAESPPVRRSPWTTKQKIVRVLWSTAGRVIWTLVPPARASVLRMFGGRVGRGCRFRRRVEILIPWNITIGDGVAVGDRVTLYALGPITIGDRVVLDDRAHLCAGTHDFTHPSFPQTRPPIAIGDDTLIGFDAYIGPGATIGAGCVVDPRASVYRTIEDGARVRGNPAKRVEDEG